jgi:hypothetical protein
VLAENAHLPLPKNVSLREDHDYRRPTGRLGSESARGDKPGRLCFLLIDDQCFEHRNLWKKES